jgi:hypothetical protein
LLARPQFEQVVQLVPGFGPVPHGFRDFGSHDLTEPVSHPVDGHLITVPGQEEEEYVIGHSLEGNLVLSKSALESKYTFMGFSCFSKDLMPPAKIAKR